MRRLSDCNVTLCGKVTCEGKELKQCISGSHGYPTVYADGKNHLVHRLVAMKYLPNPLGKRTVNHKNGNKLDNRVCNLEWATDSENNLHSYRALGRKATRGRMLVSDKDATYILSLRGEMSQKEIADMFGVKVSLVADIHTGRRRIDDWEAA